MKDEASKHCLEQC